MPSAAENESEDKADDFAEALWIGLLCECDACNKVLFLEDLHDLFEKDLVSWSKAAANAARNVGWTYIDGKILCRQCKSGRKGTAS